MRILIEISGRHAHLSQNDLEILFGKNYQLTNIKNLSQTGEFVCEEKVILKNSDENLEARVIGPVRSQTQIEISQTDADKLDLNPPRNLSGDLENSVGIILSGSTGEVNLKQGVILAQAHIHCDEENAKRYNLNNNQKVKVSYNNYIFDNIIVRVSDKFTLAMHIDVAEAKKAGIEKGKEIEGDIID